MNRELLIIRTIQALCVLAYFCFGQIMQSLSVDTKSTVDSAGDYSASSGRADSSKESFRSPSKLSNEQEVRLEKLSEEQRRRVEQAIQEVEYAKEQRKIEMMEVGKKNSR